MSNGKSLETVMAEVKTKKQIEKALAKAHREYAKSGSVASMAHLEALVAKLAEIGTAA